MNRYLSLVYFLGAFFYFSSCESYNESTEKIHKSDKPIVLTSFYPKEGGARDKILLDGENFGNDVSKIKVYLFAEFIITFCFILNTSNNFFYLILCYICK